VSVHLGHVEASDMDASALAFDRAASGLLALHCMAWLTDTYYGC
jgi:hypothetical protein